MKLPGLLLSPNSKNKKPRSQWISCTFSKKLYLYFGKQNFLVFSKKYYGFERAFFPFRRFLRYTPPHICTASTKDLRERFYPETFFNLHYFPTFGSTCFDQGFPRSQHFFHEGCRASHWGSNHRPSPYLCLNHIVFSKK